jgi:threonine dehydratase
MRSFQSGRWQPQPAPDTVADGLRTALGQLNFSLIRDRVDDIISADDPTIIRAMRLVWTRMKLIIEPSAAVGLAVVLSHPERFKGKRVAIVFSGGNVDLDRLPW